MSLQGKKALVTGSTSGIGFGIAEALLGAGASVVFSGHAFDEREANAIREICEKYHAEPHILYGDLSDPNFCESLIDQSVDRLGGLEILVNNAGVQHVAPIVDFPREKWDFIIALNLSAVFHCTKRALPKMRNAGYGRVINIASAHGLVASPEKTAYVAAKHGVIGFTKSVALETAKENITVNAVCPGWVLTPLVEAQIHKKAAEQKISYDLAKIDLLSEKQPSLQFVTPAQIGAFAVFLASDSASQITGAALSVDGGWTAR